MAWNCELGPDEMAKRNVLGWLQSGWTAFVDPERDERIERFTKQTHRKLAELKESFDFRSVSLELEIPSTDEQDVRSKVYRTCVERAWNDLTLTDKEARSLLWVASKLGLAHDDRARIDREFGHSLLERMLASFLDDGSIDDSEHQKIGEIAKWIKSDSKALVRDVVGRQGSGLIRSLFLSAVQDGELTAGEWGELASQAERLGLEKAEFQQAIQRQANDFVESVFVNAKVDGTLSPDEDKLLQWLISSLVSDPKHQVYFKSELSQLRQMTKIAQGSLPSLKCPAELTLKSGEILHAFVPANMEYTRQLKSGPVRESLEGELAVTDARIILLGDHKSIDLPYRSVIASYVQEDGVVLRCANKGVGSGAYRFRHSPQLNAAILDCAIRRSKQTVVDTTGEGRTRSIPRDVRQRVWSKYGGRCAECGSDQYLEFDHIVPFSRGGSNTDQNVQLLCRRCNLKKLDAI